MQTMWNRWGIRPELLEQAKEIEGSLAPVWKRIAEVREYNQLKVLSALQEARISESDFGGTTGYGYDDKGRDQLEVAFAKAFGAEAALVRAQISAGTQALTVAFFGVLRPGDELLSITGTPYDTLARVIGLDEEKSNEGSLKDFGVHYREIPLSEQTGGIDVSRVCEELRPETKLVLIQRSRGYGLRRSLRVKEIGEAIAAVKARRPDVVVMVDNCYGEFTDYQEPTELGADLCVGSLIKNPGGGLAPTGGYIVGKQEWVERCANRLYAPGLGLHAGPSLGLNRAFTQGFFLAPHTVSECLRGLSFAAALFRARGFESQPAPEEERSDIIQTLTFHSPEPMIAFCQAIQQAAPVDSYVRPEPWPMPGYACDVIMAAGAFVQGSSIELSADGPVEEPYTVFMQGGLVYENVKLAALLACEQILRAEAKEQA